MYNGINSLASLSVATLAAWLVEPTSPSTLPVSFCIFIKLGRGTDPPLWARPSPLESLRTCPILICSFYSKGILFVKEYMDASEVSSGKPVFSHYGR